MATSPSGLRVPGKAPLDAKVMLAQASPTGSGDTAATLRILIATDNHLGYNEKDAVRGNDSFDTFEEILRTARDAGVDMLLLGGDLFHDNKPSRRTVYRTMSLLRHYCMGSRPCALELLSDPSVNFSSTFGTVNYEDPNYNIALPVFTIHGNHDDPSGDGNLSALDILSSAGLINYFGKYAAVDHIDIMPVLLRKAETKLAIFGLGSVRDERLHRTFINGGVRMMRPPSPEEYYNIFMIHQNRAAHSPTSCIPEHFIDNFIDLVIWGHEHDCMHSPQSSAGEQVSTPRFICQPGSSVATSLSAGEALPKHIVLLTLNGRAARRTYIPLRTVRPFIHREVSLARALPPTVAAEDGEAINSRLVAIVEEALAALAREDGANAKAPLIRLVVDYSPREAQPGSRGAAPPHTHHQPFATINVQRFGLQFGNRIANPRNILHFVRRSRPQSGPPKARHLLALDDGSAASAHGDESMQATVKDMVSRFLDEQQLDIFPRNEFNDTVQMAVDKDDKDVIERFVKTSMARTIGGIGERARTSSSALLLLEKTSLLSEFGRMRKHYEQLYAAQTDGAATEEGSPLGGHTTAARPQRLQIVPLGQGAAALTAPYDSRTPAEEDEWGATADGTAKKRTRRA